MPKNSPLPSASKLGAGDGSGREALIAATIAVVAKKGMRGLTFRAVAEEANVNNSLVAHYFGNRDGLIEAAFNRSIEVSIHDSGLGNFAESKEIFTETLLGLMNTVEEQQNELFQYEMLLESRRNNDLSPKILEHYRQFTTTLAQSVAEATNTPVNIARAGYLFAALDGLVLQRLAGVDEEIIAEAIHQLWDDIIRITR